jgi:hypothetical protein
MKTLALALLLATPVLAAPPNIVNGTVQSAVSLSSAPANGWVGYRMTAAQPTTISCCDSWNGTWRSCNNCRLEGEGSTNISRNEPEDLAPVGSRSVALFARFQDGAVNRIRIYSPDCQLDASGQSVRWIDNVSEAASIAFLKSVVERGSKKGREGSLLALSMHEGATDTLIDIARNNADRDVRGHALFWLAQQAGRKAAGALRDAVDNDPEASVREKAVFGISQLPNDQSIPLLIELMRTHRTAGVRKKAAFWLGQKNDPRALAAIEDLLR